MTAARPPLLLASHHLGALPDFLDRAGVEGRRARLDVRAAEPLADAAAIVADLRRQLERLGLRVVADGDEADLLVVGGGDPFHLLARMRAAPPTGLGTLPYVGVSAGAMVAAPTLEPVTLTTPFTPPRGLDLRGLGLCDVLCLCHRHRAGRAARHRDAIARFGRALRIVELADSEAVEIHDGAPALVRSPRVGGAKGPAR
jgi:dipeptidase E